MPVFSESYLHSWNLCPKSWLSHLLPPPSKLISVSIKELSPGLTKWMGILVFTSEKARIFPHVSLPESSEEYLHDTFFYLAVHKTHTTSSSAWLAFVRIIFLRQAGPYPYPFFVTFVLLIQQPWTAVVSLSYITVNHGGKEWQKCINQI